MLLQPSQQKRTTICVANDHEYKLLVRNEKRCLLAGEDIIGQIVSIIAKEKNLIKIIQKFLLECDKKQCEEQQRVHGMTAMNIILNEECDEIMDLYTSNGLVFRLKRFINENIKETDSIIYFTFEYCTFFGRRKCYEQINDDKTINTCPKNTNITPNSLLQSCYTGFAWINKYREKCGTGIRMNYAAICTVHDELLHHTKVLSEIVRQSTL